MKHLIIGTAGHVDHGKTSLVRALTGVDTDRLKEEKERGITIELGFAPLALKNGDIIGIVDVPGHERFVRNMVAGAGGIDVVILVIAADEGIMPQTREHLNICSLLGIRHGLVALTKTDLVDHEWLTLISEDVKTYLRGTFLGDAPVVPLSIATGEGIPEFLAALEETARRVEERPSSGFFRLPVDRVFSMKGFGTVVTGSLVSGRVTGGDAVEILPSLVPSKVRGIQIHGMKTETAKAGDRTAINLQGVERASIQRGDVLAHPGIFVPSVRLDVLLTYLQGNRKKLKHRTFVRFHTGTCEVMARILFLERDDMGPGETAFAQVMLETPAVAAAHDRFVIRSYSPITTIGGGEIIDPCASKLKRGDGAPLSALQKLTHGTSRERVETVLERAGAEGITDTVLSVRTGMPRASVGAILDDMHSEKKVVLLDGEERRFVSFPAYETLQRNIMASVTAYHARNPLKEWIPKEELRITIGSYINGKLFQSALRELQERERLTVEKDNVRVAGHRITLQDDLMQLRNAVGDVYTHAGLTPPSARELFERFPDKKEDVRKVVTLLVHEGFLVKVNEDFLFAEDALRRLREDYKKLLEDKGKVVPALFRDMTGLSRKFVIPLMEYFDKIKFTMRVEDYRVIRKERDGA